jgi:hypothetical protein
VARLIADQAKQDEAKLAAVEQATTTATPAGTFGKGLGEVLEAASAAEAAAPPEAAPHRVPHHMLATIVTLAATATMGHSKTHDNSISYLSRS